VNLKEAAARLNVHYQSVYRWVRSGELASERTLGRYEISEYSLAVFESRRCELLERAAIAQTAVPSGAAAGLDELAVVASNTRLSAQACFDSAVDHLAIELRGCSVIRLLDADGSFLTTAATHAYSPRYAAILGDLAHGTSMPADTLPWSAPLSSKNPRHVEVLGSTKETFTQLVEIRGVSVDTPDVMTSHAITAIRDGDAAIGVISVGRSGLAPLSSDDVDLLRRVAELCGEAVAMSRSYAGALTAVRDLRARLLTADYRATSDHDVYSLLRGDGLEAVFDGHGRPIAMTSGFAKSMGIQSSDDGSPSALRAEIGSLVESGAEMTEVVVGSSRSFGPIALLCAIRPEPCTAGLVAVVLAAHSAT